MGKNLVMCLYSVIVSIFVAYIAGLGLSRGEEFMAVFRMTAAAILGYAASAMIDSIWKGQRWTITLKFIFDGLAYGVGYQYSAEAGNLIQGPFFATPSTQSFLHILAGSA